MFFFTYSLLALVAVLMMVQYGSSSRRDITTLLKTVQSQLSKTENRLIKDRERRDARPQWSSWNNNNNDWHNNNNNHHDSDYDNDYYTDNHYNERGDVFYWNDPPYSEKRTTTTTTTARPRPAQIIHLDPAYMEMCRKSCFRVQEYNPVCGDDRRTYRNPTSLKCWASCGGQVSILHYGNCLTPDPDLAFPRRVEATDIMRMKPA